MPGTTESFVYDHQIRIDVRSYGADDMKITWECRSWRRGTCLPTWLAQAGFPQPR
ncbi:hypothetical protein ACQ4WP_08525 [Janthinobacterium sp. GB4P2]|uniref:hypothetical protein n=1 Tax=Janthinobacterium sp. GB4P2 TaxID=3424189 RepID=UPI003F22CEA7